MSTSHALLVIWSVSTWTTFTKEKLYLGHREREHDSKRERKKSRKCERAMNEKRREDSFRFFERLSPRLLIGRWSFHDLAPFRWFFVRFFWCLAFKTPPSTSSRAQRHAHHLLSTLPRPSVRLASPLSLSLLFLSVSLCVSGLCDGV